MVGAESFCIFDDAETDIPVDCSPCVDLEDNLDSNDLPNILSNLEYLENSKFCCPGSIPGISCFEDSSFQATSSAASPFQAVCRPRPKDDLSGECSMDFSTVRQSILGESLLRHESAEWLESLTTFHRLDDDDPSETNQDALYNWLIDVLDDPVVDDTNGNEINGDDMTGYGSVGEDEFNGVGVNIGVEGRGLDGVVAHPCSDEAERHSLLEPQLPTPDISTQLPTPVSTNSELPPPSAVPSTAQSEYLCRKLVDKLDFLILHVESASSDFHNCCSRLSSICARLTTRRMRRVRHSKRSQGAFPALVNEYRQVYAEGDRAFQALVGCCARMRILQESRCWMTHIGHPLFNSTQALQDLCISNRNDLLSHAYKLSADEALSNALKQFDQKFDDKEKLNDKQKFDEKFDTDPSQNVA